MIITVNNGILLEDEVLKGLEKQINIDNKQINGDELLVLMAIRHNQKRLTKHEILKELTYKNKTYMDEILLNKCLYNLINNKYVERINGIQEMYISNICSLQNTNTIRFSFFCILGVLAKYISSEDLKMYVYIKYRLNKGMSTSSYALANVLGLPEQKVLEHIQNLISEKYIKSTYIQ